MLRNFLASKGRHRPRAFTLAAALLGFAASGNAATDTGQLTVTATVLNGCSLVTGSLDFGQYVSGQNEDLDVEGEISFANCSGTLVFDLDGGGAGNVSQRQMASGAERLNYQIFRNPTRNANWGQGNDALTLELFSSQSGSVPVYGRIPGGQAISAGVYTDTVNITLTF
ncbi:MAG: spore coat U domain-containing protein [Pseudomonadota bacterium]